MREAQRCLEEVVFDPVALTSFDEASRANRASRVSGRPRSGENDDAGTSYVRTPRPAALPVFDFNDEVNGREAGVADSSFGSLEAPRMLAPNLGGMQEVVREEEGEEEYNPVDVYGQLDQGVEEYRPVESSTPPLSPTSGDINNRSSLAYMAPTESGHGMTAVPPPLPTSIRPRDNFEPVEEEGARDGIRAIGEEEEENEVIPVVVDSDTLSHHAPYVTEARGESIPYAPVYDEDRRGSVPYTTEGRRESIPTPSTAPYVSPVVIPAPSNYERPYVPREDDGAYHGGAGEAPLRPYFPPPPPSHPASQPPYSRDSIQIPPVVAPSTPNRPPVIRGESALGSKYGDVYVPGGGAGASTSNAGHPVGHFQGSGTSGYNSRVNGGETSSIGSGAGAEGGRKVVSASAFFRRPPPPMSYPSHGQEAYAANGSGPSASDVVRDSYRAAGATGGEGEEVQREGTPGSRFDVSPLHIQRREGRGMSPAGAEDG